MSVDGSVSFFSTTTRTTRLLLSSFPRAGNSRGHMSLRPCAGYVSKERKHSNYTFGQISSLSPTPFEFNQNSQLLKKKLKNSKNTFSQPTRKSIDLDEAMKHFARTSARCCDKARSGRDPWVNGGALK